MSGNMSSHRISMVYGGFEGFWRSYDPRQVLTSLFLTILGIQNFDFSGNRHNFTDPEKIDKIRNLDIIIVKMKLEISSTDPPPV